MLILKYLTYSNICILIYKTPLKITFKKKKIFQFVKPRFGGSQGAALIPNLNLGRKPATKVM